MIVLFRVQEKNLKIVKLARTLRTCLEIFNRETLESAWTKME